MEIGIDQAELISKMKEIALVLLLLFANGVVLGQDSIVPAKVDIMRFSQMPSDRIYAIAEIMPFGWSRDGKFAYLQKKYIAGRGGTLFSYVVINTVTDEVIWQYDDDWLDSNSVDAEVSFAKNRVNIETILDEYNIVHGKGVRLHNFPLVLNGNEYESKLEIIKKTGEALVELEESGMVGFLGDIQSFKTYIVLNGRKKKNIFTKHDPKAFSYWVSGFFQSPFEERILVVIGEETWGNEGTEGGFIFSGCSLNTGFAE
jgi:hypothetical protein